MPKKLKLCGSLVGTLYKCSTKFQIFSIIVKNFRHIKVKVNFQVTNYRPQLHQTFTLYPILQKMFSQSSSIQTFCLPTFNDSYVVCMCIQLWPSIYIPAVAAAKLRIYLLHLAENKYVDVTAGSWALQLISFVSVYVVLYVCILRLFTNEYGRFSKKSKNRLVLQFIEFGKLFFRNSSILLFDLTPLINSSFNSSLTINSSFKMCRRLKK